MQTPQTQHLADQILAAYRDKSPEARALFDELTSAFFNGERSLQDVKELEKMLGYDFKTDTWQS